jgi:putative ABC transport system permease protein
MSLLENVRMALSSLLAHKLRSILTMIGIIIGVASVILVVSIGQGGEQMLKSRISGPSNTIEILYQPSEEEMNSQQNRIMQDPFTEEDIERLKKIPEVKNVVPTSSDMYETRYKEKNISATAIGITSSYIEINDFHISNGRSFTPIDFLSGRRVAVITKQMSTELFKNHNPIGKIIWVLGQPFEVIGVLKESKGLFSIGEIKIYIPMNTYRSAFGKHSYNQVTLQAKSADDIKTMGKKAEQILNSAHNTKDSYQALNFEEMAKAIGEITSIMTLIISSIAGISLLVGGIGVMNIMLVSVTERTREIGIRKSLGATQTQILIQFLIESMTLTLIGGIIGILLGGGAASLVSFLSGWPFLVSWKIVVGGLLFSMFIGIIFGLLPANKAARLDPVQALRYE